MHISDLKHRAQIVVKELEQLYPQPQMALNYSTQWELVLAVMLSAQTTDKQVNVVTGDLFKKYPTIDHYVNASVEEFQQDINRIGLYKNKGKNAIASAILFKEKFGGELPTTIEEMIELPGVGRKTANVVLAEAYGITEGIAVDTHVVRLTNKYRLTKNKTPKKIEQDLMKILPKRDWRYFTVRMVQYGRDYSPASNKGSDDPISQKLLK
jgi:endonuclease III